MPDQEGTTSEFLSTPSARRATIQRPYVYEEFRNFYPRPPRGGRLFAVNLVFDCVGFLSTPSARRATLHVVAGQIFLAISIHALREEGDVCTALCGLAISRFLSTPSARRATKEVMGLVKEILDFYPRPPRGGRRFRDLRDYAVRNISIHALREEGDTGGKAMPYGRPIFLSTPSARRATAYRLDQ